MRTIHKFTLRDAYVEIEVPREAKFLCAAYQQDQQQDGKLVIVCWYELDTADPDVVKKTLVYVGTGWNVNEYVSANGIYLGTVHVLFHSPYVWHVYEELGWRSERENRNAKN